jgi:hypothetical protein
MSSLASFIQNYGITILTFVLILATLWYAFGTWKMLKITVAEHELKIVPSPNFSLPKIITENWERYEVTQEVVDASPYFVIIKKAEFRWKISLHEKEELEYSSIQHQIPYSLAPGQKIEIHFSIAQNKLTKIRRPQHVSLRDVISGYILYEIGGYGLKRSLIKKIDIC